MVVPMDDGGGPGMMTPVVGPPPPFLLQRLTKIKYCLIGQIFGLVLQFSTGIPLMPHDVANNIVNGLNTLLIIVVGIFLLKDDRCFGAAHSCLVQTCCANCTEQCQGGMPCLCTWFAICTIAGVAGLLPIDGSKIMLIYAGCILLRDPSKATQAPNDKIQWGFTPGTDLWTGFFIAYVVSQAILLLSQILGAWHGWKGFMDMQNSQSEGLLGGDLTGAGGTRDGGWSNQATQAAPANFAGSGYTVGGGGRAGEPATLESGRAQEGPAPSAPPRQQGFQAFQGQGNRLGT